jgi:hypothetical protein
MDSDTARTARHAVSEQQLDAAIDVVAREMTGLEPSSALRVRVLERIEQDRLRPGFAIPRWAWAGVAAVLVVAVATGLWLTRPVPGPGDSDGIVAERRAPAPTSSDRTPPRQVAQAGGEPGAMPSPPAGQPAPGARALRVPTRGAQAMAWAPAGAVAEHDALVPALADITPLGFSTVEPAPIDVPGVDVNPLRAVPSLDIPSLNPGSADTQSADPKKEK